ncbi:MAG: hypothetical protein A3H72_00940 [Candidatus Doudnabacteria bacterium RIFCSPLOWO2_02_FULL_48_8]|uniref:Uncharacterized protein n=1 Tax=Candidatus Doudnabacteria bacterium RIFCSPHIGHO2_01_FULL_46_24 TaxID=1817825 RepID=A0A1F5NUH1_9BACT|nr:MAG: hypothetical protein A2720_03725 [Candidatus Doudnabacteria bacterium RIFCSPHIGHO2_01_FULL_46_24]OGE95278.1 MAG: hypothetical protein A3H72_00940 [Candidatus Doudnabacteria bacterium RIFCSPLOWO2_02_FULL_48_8]OGE95858.1 MAG: hypothetical protein A3E98_03735 [Candidatus Doudnabacteria bacterium RIFCSPHIGHO2_12_FULL_48_11]
MSKMVYNILFSVQNIEHLNAYHFGLKWLEPKTASDGTRIPQPRAVAIALRANSPKEGKNATQYQDR